MEIGISTASLFLRENTEDCFKILDGLDSKVTEVFLETFPEYNTDFGRVLKERQGETKVHSMHVHTMHYEPDLFSNNPRSFDFALKTYKDVLSVGKMLGAKCYTMHGRARIKRSGNYDDYKAIGERLDMLAKTAREYGIDLCLENVEWAFYNRVGFFKEVLKYAPDLKATFDIKQARLSGYEPFDYIEEMGDRIRTVHLSDIAESGRMCLPGKGITDYKTLFEKLKSVGFDGNMLIEVYSQDYNDYEELTESLKYLRKIKDEVWRI